MNIHTTMPLGSLCSGYGGLEMGIARVLPVEVAWVADHEPATPKNPNPKQGPSIILAHRFPGVPNLGDITTVDWATTPPVRIICGGTPCQDVSAAGARAGMRAGTRSGIWSSMVEAINHHRPALVVWENVRGALSAAADSNVEPCPLCMGDERECSLRALGRVLGDLAELGYDAVWCGLSASDVGAPHGRYRVFVLAWPADADGERLAWSEPDAAGRPEAKLHARRLVEPDADADSIGSVRGGGARRRWSVDPDHRLRAPDADDARPQGPQPAGRRKLPDRCAATDPASDGRVERRAEATGHLGRPDAAFGGAGSAVPDTLGSGRDGRAPQPLGEPVRRTPTPWPGAGPADDAWGDFGPAVHRWESILGRPAPAPTELSRRGSQALAPRFVEWMMGLAEGWVTDVPGLTRNDQLKALGNGVVPQQVAVAISYLVQFAPRRLVGA